MEEQIWLSGVLVDVANIGGRDAARRMARRFGGGEIYIPYPGAIGEGHPLAVCVGLDNARELARHLGRGFIKVPLGKGGGRGPLVPRIELVVKNAIAEGLGRSRVARIAGVSITTVEKYIRIHRASAMGGALPD